MYSHLMSNEVGWLAVGTWFTITFVIFLYLNIISLKFLKRVFWDTPNRTTTFFARWYALIPSVIFASTFIVIYVEKKHGASSAIDLIPLVLLQLPIAIYNSRVVNLNCIKDKNKNIHIEDSEAQKIIEKERAFISVTSIFSVLVAYACILYFQPKIDVDFKVLFLILIIISVFTFMALRIFIYSKFLKDEHKNTQKKQLNH